MPRSVNTPGSPEDLRSFGRGFLFPITRTEVVDKWDFFFLSRGRGERRQRRGGYREKQTAPIA